MTAVYLKVHEDHEDDENAGIEVRQQWLEDSKKLRRTLHSPLARIILECLFNT